MGRRERPSHGQRRRAPLVSASDGVSSVWQAEQQPAERRGEAAAAAQVAPADHQHTHTLSRQSLRVGFYLTIVILLVEAVGGVFAHSLALLSDAGHIVTDVIALGLAWFAAAQAERPADARRTYGYHRVGILTALANGVTLVVIAGIIAYEAYRRLMHPEPVQPLLMLGAALIGIAVNLVIARRLHGHSHANLNVRAATLHVIGDIGASAGVVVGAFAIIFTGTPWVDPVISLLIALLIAIGSVRLIRETLHILLEAAPTGVSVPVLVRDMRGVSGVHDVHDLHVWSISSGMHALSCHAVIDDIPPSASAKILDNLADMLRSRHNIAHSTVQFESTAHDQHEGFCACPPATCETLYCDLKTAEENCTAGHTHSRARHVAAS